MNTIFGVNRVAPRSLRRGDDLVDPEVALRRGRRADAVRLVRHAHVERRAIGVGVNGHGRDSHLVQRPRDAKRYLTAVGDEHLAKGGDHGSSLSRKRT
jgi:hypothetical protein